MWIDTHCHLDAPEFEGDRDAVRSQAREQGVGLCVFPSVERAHWAGVQALAVQHADAYALGIHPLRVPQAADDDLQALDAALQQCRADPRLVAVGEIGLDFFVPELCSAVLRERQWRFYTAQLALARKYQLPVILHVRRSADALLTGLRQVRVSGGIAHAFNGSEPQARAFMALGFALGFGGAMTYDRATRLRALARTLPLDALVLETDAPDMPPHWLYRTAAERESGHVQGRNMPAQLPRIAQVLADLRQLPLQVVAEATGSNARRVLPCLQVL